MIYAFLFLIGLAVVAALILQIKTLTLIKKLIMTIDDSVVQQLIDAINTALAAEATDQAAVTAANATIASLQSQLAPNPTLLASAQTAIQNALAANPPPATTPPATPAS